MDMLYRITVYRDTLELHVADRLSDVVFDYRIRNLTERFELATTFLMPRSDTVKITWYNGSAESLTVVFPLNPAVLDSLPIDNDSVAIVYHPGDVASTYYATAFWSNCRPTDRTIPFGTKVTFLPPVSSCKLDNIIFSSEDTVSRGYITRSYGAEYHAKIQKCSNSPGNCKVLR
jgi:hypothetical protein